MSMNREQAEKLERYFVTADPFLGGVLETMNGEYRLKQIKNLGFLQDYPDGLNLTYDQINKDLCIELGIEGILEKLVVPQAHRCCDTDGLKSLRRFWDQKQNPHCRFLKAKKPLKSQWLQWKGEREYGRPLLPKDPVCIKSKDRNCIYIRIDPQTYFPEGWTTFAKLWFEIIEPCTIDVLKPVS